MFCSKCGAELKNSENYCSNCGMSITLDTTIQIPKKEDKVTVSEKMILYTGIFIVVVVGLVVLAFKIGWFSLRKGASISDKVVGECMEEAMAEYLWGKGSEKEIDFTYTLSWELEKSEVDRKNQTDTHLYDFVFLTDTMKYTGTLKVKYEFEDGEWSVDSAKIRDCEQEWDLSDKTWEIKVNTTGTPTMIDICISKADIESGYLLIESSIEDSVFWESDGVGLRYYEKELDVNTFRIGNDFFSVDIDLLIREDGIYCYGVNGYEKLKLCD